MIKSFLRFVALLGAMMLFVSPSLAQRSNITLKVASFAGPFGDALQKYAFDIFTMRTGIKVEVQYANPADHLAKMIASRGREAPFDVVCLDDDVTSLGKQNKLFLPMDAGIVTNLKHLYPEGKDPENMMAVMFYFSFGIAYNTEKFKAAGIPAPTSWHDLWDPRLSGRISIPDIVNIQGRDFVVQVSKLLGGDETTPERAIDKIAEIKAHSYNTASSTLQAQLESGDVWVAPWNNMRTTAMTNRGLPIAFVTPKEGGVGNMDYVAVVAGTRYPKEAQLLVNYILDPFAQMGMSKLLPTGPSNSLLEAVVAADTELKRDAPATPEAHKALYLPDWDKFNPHLKRATDHWNRKIQK
jgi:putative spermidine/putrescine transport system substrate-binding protein